MTNTLDKSKIQIKSLNSPVSQTFKKGKYLVGDLCYVYPDDEWSDYVNENFKNARYGEDIAGAILTYNGIDIFTCATAYGDGEYPVIQDGKEIGSFGVDAGMTALIPLELAKTWPEYENKKDSYVLIKLNKDFEIEVFGDKTRPGNWKIDNGVDNFEVLTDYDEDEDNEDDY